MSNKYKAVLKEGSKALKKAIQIIYKIGYTYQKRLFSIKSSNYRLATMSKNFYRNQQKGGLSLIESFADYCTFKAHVTKVELLNLLTDRRLEKLIKHKENLQCHNHPRICLKLSWNQCT